MVYPVSGGAQQIPAANTFQPGGQTPTVKNPAQDTRVESTKVSGTEPGRIQNTEDKTVQKNQVFASADRSQDTGGVSANSSRGSTIDISV